MRGSAVSVCLLLVLTLAAVAAAHELDHAPPTFSQPAGPASSQVNAGGDGAEWELITTIPTGNPHTDLDFFTKGRDTYMSAGTLGTGPNAGGQNLFRLTEDGVVKPSYVGAHPSAACPQVTQSATGLQHDVEATPKGDAFQQQPNPFVAKGDAQLLVDRPDAGGRCHDSGASFGASSAPPGGLELIDITDVNAPKEIGLISHIGNAHTVNVDPKRPHIAFDITQDGVKVCPNGKRDNEEVCPPTTPQPPPNPITAPPTTRNALDGFEVIDFSSCMNFPAGTTIAQKRERCRPEVYRYRYPEARMALSHTYPDSLQSCHESEIYPDDKLACASITATLLFDLKGAFDDRGTPNDYTDDKPRGTPLPCKVRPSSSPDGGGLRTGAPITDCINGTVNGRDQSLQVKPWLDIGAPSLEGVEWLGTVPHLGFRVGDSATIAAAPPERGSKVDILAAHESEITQSGRYVITSDERGGGTLPPGATCATSPADNPLGNGGLHFLRTDRFSKATPLKPEQADEQWARMPNGEKAVHRATIRTAPQGSICTSHVFQQIPGQNRIFMGWYSQGTQVIDFTENPDGTVSFKEAGYFIPENSNSWVSHIFKAQRNQDGTFTYWGASSDGILPGAGRSAIDVYKVTLPPAPIPAGGPRPGTPEFPLSRVKGVENERRAPCASSTAFERAQVGPRGRRGLTFSFARRGRSAVTVDLFRSSRGGTIGQRRVKRFARRSRSFSWDGRGRGVTDGFYNARFTTRTPEGGTDVRRVALQRRDGRFTVRPQFYRRTPCQLLETAKLSRPVFGGRRKLALGVSFRLNRAADVAVEVRQRGRVVARFPKRAYVAGRTIRLRLASSRVRRRGDVQVVLRATRTGQAVTQTITARRL